MSTTDSTGTTDSTDPEQIEAEIARHREELGHTVDDLAARFDVREQAQQRIQQVRTEARGRVEALKDRAGHADASQLAALAVPVLGALAGILVLVGVVRKVRG